MWLVNPANSMCTVMNLTYEKKKKVVMNHDNIKLHYYNFASSF